MPQSNEYMFSISNNHNKDLTANVIILTKGSDVIMESIELEPTKIKYSHTQTPFHLRHAILF